MFELFTQVPNKDLCFKTHKSYKIKLVESFKKLLKKVTFPNIKDLNKLLKMIDGIDTEEKLNPYLFFIYFSILEGFKKKNKSLVVDSLLQLEKLEEKDLYVHGLNICTLGKSLWENHCVHELLVKEKEFNPAMETINADILKENESVIYESLNLVKSIDPEFYCEIEEYLSYVRLFQGNAISGASSPKFFGVIYLTLAPVDVDPILHFCDHIVHEVSHLHLFTLFGADKILLNSPEELYPAPIRSDKRPMYGIFHAMFVLSRMVRVFEKITSTQFIKESLREKASQMLSDMQVKYKKGYKVVSESAKLTSDGVSLLSSLKTPS